MAMAVLHMLLRDPHIALDALWGAARGAEEMRGALLVRLANHFSQSRFSSRRSLLLSWVTTWLPELNPCPRVVCCCVAR